MIAKRFKLDFDDPRAVWIDDNSNDECYTVINDTLKKKNIQEIVDLLNELHEETQKQKTTIRMLEQQSQRQINRNDRLHKDWDKLYQHLLDMGLMTDEEILKVLIE